MKWFAKLNSQLEWFFTDCPTPIQCAKSAKKQLHIPYQNAKYVISISKWHILQSLLCRLIIHSFLPQCHPSQNVISTTFHHRFVDYSLAFNTIVPATLVAKLQTLGQNRSLCSWILDFLTGRSQNGQQYLISPDPQHWCSTGLRPQPTPVLPVHTRLYSNTQLQRHRQICRWHNGDRSDHRQRWDGLQRGGEYPDKMVSGEPPLTQHRQDQGAGGGLQETEQRTHTHHHRQDTCGAGDQL